MTVVLLWDIDGTLLTTGRAGVFALEHAAREVCGDDVSLQEMHTAGLTDGEIAARIIGDSGAAPELVEHFLEVYAAALPDALHRRRGQVMDGVTAILDDLRDEPAVLSLLLTGNVEAGARAKLAHYGLDGSFEAGAFCRGSERRADIARRAVALAADRFDPQRTFVIGDTPADVACGEAVGVRTIAVASGVYSVEELADAGAWRTLPALPAPADFRRLVGLAHGRGSR